MENKLKHSGSEAQKKPEGACADTTGAVALVLGDGITALGVIRSFGRAKIPLCLVCPRGDLPTKSRWYRPAPLFSNRIPSPSELADYLSGLAIRRAVLVPCSDDWAKAVSALPEKLKDRFPASVASPQVMDILTDKWLFTQMAQGLGIPCPNTILLNSLAEMSALPDSCYQNRFLKPVESTHFCRRHKVKAFQLKNKTDALETMSKQAMNGTSEFPILLQEYIPGPPTNYYLVDGFVDREGRIRGLISRRRIRMFPPVFGNSTLSETISLHDVKGAVEALHHMWSEVPYRGIFDAEFKYDDRDGQFKIIEVNARPWWHVGFVARCGVDLCRMSYLDALDLPVEPVSGYPIARRTAYLASDFRVYRATNQGFGGFVRWVRSWMGAYDAIYSWEDLWPGVWFTLKSIKHVRRA
jgi:predicted ATP-grasp superfamily ATP-dependent carboligase